MSRWDFERCTFCGGVLAGEELEPEPPEDVEKPHHRNKYVCYFLRAEKRCRAAERRADKAEREVERMRAALELIAGAGGDSTFSSWLSDKMATIARHVLPKDKEDTQ